MRFLDDIHSVSDLVKKVKEYQNHILTTIGVIALLVGSTYGYFYYKQRREERAYRTLVVSLEQFDAPIKSADGKSETNFLEKKEFKTEKEKWETVELTFKKAYQAHSGSGLAPVFLAYQSEALVQLGRLPEAIAVLRKAVSLMPSRDVKAYYQGKLAVMLLDTKNDASIKEGIAALTTLAADDKGVAHDMALHQLGLYYWHQKRFKEARNYWNQLILKYDKLKKHVSPWVAVAKEKLRLIDSDVE